MNDDLPSVRPALHVVPQRVPPPRRSVLATVVRALLDWAAQNDGPEPLRLPDAPPGARWDAQAGCHVLGDDRLCNRCQRPMRTEPGGWRCVPCALWHADPGAVRPVLPPNPPPWHTGNRDFF